MTPKIGMRRSRHVNDQSELAVRDPGPMARFEHVKTQPETASVVFQRLCDGETLAQVARDWAVPKGRFVEWYTTEHAALYDAALKVRADDLAHEALSVADTPTLGVETKTKADGSVEVTEGDMLGHRKLQVDTKLKVASKWDRARYGEQVRVEHAGEVVLRADFSRPAPIDAEDAELVAENSKNSESAGQLADPGII